MPSVTKTPNIGLNQWTKNESPMRQDFVDDNFKIDDEIEKVKDLVKNISTKAKDITIDDPTNVFTAPNVEDALLENKTSIQDLEKKTDTTNSKVDKIEEDIKFIYSNNMNDTDINDLKQAGHYCGYKNMLNGAITNQISVMEVIAYSQDWVVQRWNIIGSKTKTLQREFIEGTTWTPWRSL